MRWFSEVIMLPTLPEGGPAITNVLTGKLRLSKEYWDILPNAFKDFVIYHELGHLQKGLSELKADDWAIEMWIRHGGKPSEALGSHDNIFKWENVSSKNDIYMVRFRRLLERAKHFDFHFNGNTNLKLS